MNIIKAIPILLLAACAPDTSGWDPICRYNEVAENSKCRPMTEQEMKAEACALAIITGRDVEMFCD